MMMQVVHLPEQAAPLFAGWEETLLWSCLQGVMGKVYAPAGEPLRAALAVLGTLPSWPENPGRIWRPLPRRSAAGTTDSCSPRARGGPGASRRSTDLGPGASPATPRKKDPAAFHRAHLTRLAGRLPLGTHCAPSRASCTTAAWPIFGAGIWWPSSPQRGDYARLGLGVAVVRQGGAGGGDLLLCPIPDGD